MHDPHLCVGCVLQALATAIQNRMAEVFHVDIHPAARCVSGPRDDTHLYANHVLPECGKSEVLHTHACSQCEHALRAAGNHHHRITLSCAPAFARSSVFILASLLVPAIRPHPPLRWLAPVLHMGTAWSWTPG